MNEPCEFLIADDALNAVREASDLLKLARNKIDPPELQILVRAAHTLLLLAYPVLKKQRF
jgi:hypothetical protein